ncbi:unnamed protein product [Moneuplotes crassus]|uniref:Uncharacterized protein n=1 Tax=Euplotes crassus TaxID=5936 RepID=A0AAD1XUW5_EUPCR|nr:unnamed protein product [Moneuplotes crassus]
MNLNHLSIYEYGIPEEYKVRLKILKVVYIIFFALTAGSVLLSSYSRLEKHNYPEFIYAGVSFLGLITSFAYILYPKYDFSKMLFTKVVIVLYVFISIGVFIGTILWLIIASIAGKKRSWSNEYYSDYLRDIGIILVIFLNPFIVAQTILLTYLLRRRIAHILNNTLDDSNEEALVDSDEENATWDDSEGVSARHNLNEPYYPIHKNKLDSNNSVDQITAANSIISSAGN